MNGMGWRREYPKFPHSHHQFSLNFKLKRITNDHILLLLHRRWCISLTERSRQGARSSQSHPPRTKLSLCSAVSVLGEGRELVMARSHRLTVLMKFSQVFLSKSSLLYTLSSFCDFNVSLYSSSVILVSPGVGPWSSSHSHPRCKSQPVFYFC